MTPFYSKYKWATYGRRESAQELWKKCEDQKERTRLFKKYVKFTFVLLHDNNVDNAEKIFSTIESLIEQSYPKWELIIQTDSSLEFSKDSRVKLVKKNSLALKDAISGDYTGTLEAGDILNPSVLYHFSLELQKNEPDLLYCNEIQVTNGRERSFSKPEYSYITLLNQNYIGKLWVAKTSLFLKNYSESEHLFFIQNAKLYSPWVLVPVFGVRREAPVMQPFHPVSPPDSSVAIQSKVSVIVCFKNKADWTKKCLKQLVGFAGKVDVEIVLVNNNSKSKEVNTLKSFLESYPLSTDLVDYPHAFNFGHMHNWAIENHASGEFILLLNNDVFLQSENCLKDMLGWATLPYVGTVGCLLKYKDGRVQHAGLTAHFGGDSRLVRVGNEQSDETLWRTTREVFGNTFAVCLMKKSTFQNRGGFRELDLANGFGDVAFNLECVQAGLKNVNLGYIEGLHLESATRGTDYEYWEECILEQKYPALLQKMVRYDLGFDRMPTSNSALRDMKVFAKAKLRQRFPWLKDVKRTLIELKTGMKNLQTNQKV